MSIKIENDFGCVDWTPEHELALELMCYSADILEMTPGEFVDMMRFEDRVCPLCQADSH